MLGLGKPIIPRNNSPLILRRKGWLDMALLKAMQERLLLVQSFIT
jgi:hypothetical protein